MQMIIRRATPGDLSTIVKFNAAMASETEDVKLDQTVLTKGVQAVLANDALGFYIVCEIDGSVCACLMITYEWSDWRNGLFWWIQSVYVDKPFRKKGCYKAMYNHIVDLIKTKENIAGLRLYVDENNTVAQKTYTKLGMQKTNYSLFEKLSNP